MVLQLPNLRLLDRQDDDTGTGGARAAAVGVSRVRLASEDGRMVVDVDVPSDVELDAGGAFDLTLVPSAADEHPADALPFEFDKRRTLHVAYGCVYQTGASTHPQGRPAVYASFGGLLARVVVPDADAAAWAELPPGQWLYLALATTA